MSAKAVVVFDSGDVPRENVECTFVSFSKAEYVFPLTNQDGYTYPPPAISAQNGYIKVVADGFKSYLQVISLDDQNQEIHIGGDPLNGPPNTIHLPPLSFSSPSRERILNVKANLCNVLDATGLPIFEPFISTLYFYDALRADDWINRLKGEGGSTHITVEITGDYDEYLPWLGGRYPIIGMDFTQNIDMFKRFLDWVLRQDLIPIVKSGCDGQAYSPGGKTYGWQWGMSNYPGILQTLKAYHRYCLWSTGYDGCFPDWTPQQLLSFIQMMRAVLGEESCIDTEFGSGPGESISYCHMGNGPADWTEDKLGDLDSFSLELQTYAQSEDEIAGQTEGMIQVYDRIGPGGFYLHNDKTQVQMYETLAYWEIREIAGFDEAKKVAQRAYNVGYRTFGNGLP